MGREFIMIMKLLITLLCLAFIGCDSDHSYDAMVTSDEYYNQGGFITREMDDDH